jgi:hypothetical protein
MDGPPAAEATHQIEQLILVIEDLRRRVTALEASQLHSFSPGTGVEFRGPVADFATDRDLSSGLLPGLGRALIAIAGAFLLRAITEAGILPPLAGSLAGVLYACAWLVYTLRISPANRPIAVLQGVTAASILAPLLWEATVRFHTLTPAAAAAILALFIAIGQVVAWQRDLAIVARVVALVGSATAVALVVATLDPVPFALALLFDAAVVEYGASRDRALAARWIIALAAAFCAFLLVYLVTRPQGVPEGYAPIPIAIVLSILGALVAVYGSSTVARTLLRRLRICWFEIAQVVVIVAVLIGSVLRLAPGVAVVMGTVCLAAAMFCYVAACTGLARRPWRNFHAYATFAALLAATGSLLVFSGWVLALLWMSFALVAVWLGEKRGSNALRLHGAFYLTASAQVSGLLAWPPSPPAAGLCAAGAALAYAVILWMRRGKPVAWTERVAAFVVAAILSWSFVGLGYSIHLDARSASTVHTALVCLAAVALAWFGSRWNLNEVIWLLYPWMIFGMFKLVAEDLRRGGSSIFSLSLLIYGGTLIVLPRLVRRARSAQSGLSLEL